MSALSMTDPRTHAYAETPTAAAALPRRKAPFRWIEGLTPARALGIVCIVLAIIVTVLSIVVGVFLIHFTNGNDRANNQDQKIINLGGRINGQQDRINQLEQRIIFLEARPK